jgi:hypothetical protein
MSRQRSVARDRRRQNEGGRAEWVGRLREEVEAARNADARDREGGAKQSEGAHHGSLWQVFRRLADADVPVWDVAHAVDLSPDERAMVMQVVAPRLMYGKPKTVIAGHLHASRLPVAEDFA